MGSHAKNALTVGELIEKLRTLPSDLPLVMENDSYGESVLDAWTDEDLAFVWIGNRDTVRGCRSRRMRLYR